MGIVLFPDWLIGDRLKSGELVGLLPELDTSIKTEPQHIAAIYPNARHPPLNVRAIIDYYWTRSVHRFTGSLNKTGDFMARLEVNFRFWRRAHALNALKVCFERRTDHTI